MRRDGERDSSRAPAPEHAEVTGLGNVDQQVAARRRGLGLQQRVDADEPFLVEVAVESSWLYGPPTTTVTPVLARAARCARSNSIRARW